MSDILDTSFSGLGNGASFGTDYRAALQSALNTAASQGKGLTLTQNYGLSLDSNGIALSMPSNSRLKFTGNGALRLLPHNATDYKMIIVDGKSNVVIEKPVLDGAKENNGAIGGEYGMGISIYNGSNIVINEPDIKDTWGDGIYVGGDGTPPSNIKVFRPNIRGVRRNGISIISAIGLDIYSPKLGNITETNPKAGIDFEPNNNSNQLQNINIYSPETVACNLGIEFALQGLVGSVAQNVSINVYDWKDVRSLDTALNRYAFSKGSYSVTGQINVHNVTYVKSNILHDFQAWDNSIIWYLVNETSIV
jgi:hypothetical protein